MDGRCDTVPACEASVGSEDVRLPHDTGSIGSLDSTGLEGFGGVGVTRDDPVELGLGGAEVVADELAEEIGRAHV